MTAARRSGGSATRNHTIYLGLGTNVGDRGENLRNALSRLAAFMTVDSISSVYHSEPVGYRTQPDFWNMVVHARTNLEPTALLDRLKEIERAMGRRKRFRDAPRVIDIDILVYDHARVRTRALTIPHPRMLERGFVLRPLAEIEPELRHPISGRTIADHLSDAADSLEKTDRLFPGDELLG